MSDRTNVKNHTNVKNQKTMGLNCRRTWGLQSGKVVPVAEWSRNHQAGSKKRQLPNKVVALWSTNQDALQPLNDSELFQPVPTWVIVTWSKRRCFKDVAENSKFQLTTTGLQLDMLLMAVVFAITEPLLTMKEGSYFYSLDARNELRTTGDLRRKGQLYSLGERTEGLPSRTEQKLLHSRMP